MSKRPQEVEKVLHRIAACAVKCKCTLDFATMYRYIQSLEQFKEETLHNQERKIDDGK